MNRPNIQRRLMSSAAIAAGLIALAFGGPAHAQGVNGTAQVTSGTASVVNSPNQTTVTTGGSNTIINWQPTDTAPTGAPINFLPATGTLSFYGTGNYTVLNRFIAVNPVTGAPIPISRQIQMAGTVNSFIGNPNASVGNVQGGNIWFYNAGGFLISSTGVINVGSLVLTSNDIDTTGGFLGPGGEIRFRGAAGSTATVQIDSGASVNVGNPLGGSAYAAIVAPRVIQRGRVNVDGSIAYVAAEQADIRINNGLFDINVLVGAEGGNVIDHSGVTTGAAPVDADGYDSRIYMVAMPKNDAVTMLVSGQIGYLDPVVAQVEPNGAIRLAAGYNIIGGEISVGPGSAAPANMAIRDVIFNSELRARATNNLDAAPVSTIPSIGNLAFIPPPQLGLIRFNKSAILSGDNRATLTIANQQAVIAGSDLSLVSGGRGGNPGLTQVSLSHNPALPGNRPLLTVGGGLLLDSSIAVDPFSGGDVTGGTARVSVNGGLLNASSITIQADSTAGYGSAAQGGNAAGGNAEFIVTDAGAVVNATSVSLSANATGGGRRFNQNINGFESAQQGGSANGGTAIVSVSNGAALTATQGMAIEARAQGGTGNLVSGNATGGIGRLSVSSPASRVTSGFTSINTNAVGGSFASVSVFSSDSDRGGNGTGGTSEIVTDGVIDLGSTFLLAEGTGGNANSGANRGGDGFGGTANLLASGGTVLLSGLTVDIDGLAGGGLSDPLLTTSTHGVGRGGTTAIRTDSATITVNGDVSISGNGNTASGAGINTLQRDGGDVEIRASNSGAILIAGSLAVQVDAGFDPTLGTSETSNQQATGGTIRVSAVDGSTISAVGLDLNARAYTSTATGTVGTATGGDITLETFNNGQILSGARGSFINTSGIAGSGPIGGRGVGGNVSVVADGGRVNLGVSSQFDANGTSGVSSSAVAGALGQGGTVRLQTTNTPGPSEILIGDLIVNTTGQSGEIEESGFVVAGNTAGDGQGGQFIVDMNGGHIVGSSLNASATGFGGASNAAQGGGSGGGGSVNLNITAGLLDVNTIQLTANGQGDRGGSGQRSGNGFGGTVNINVNGGTIDTNSFSATATGTGGAGNAGANGSPSTSGDGGDGEGGSVNFNANSGTVIAGTITLNAGGTGGTGGSYDAQGLAALSTGDGGDGRAGNARFELRGAAVSANRLTVIANGQGGAGGELLNGAGAIGTASGGDGGDGIGGEATMLIAGNASNIVRFGVSATGIGGTGASVMVGGDGGDAQGGTAALIVDGVNAGSIIADVNAGSSGGNGGSGSNGSGGDGGIASGGTARLSTTGAGAAIMVDPNSLNLEAFGGRGGNGARNPALAAPAGGANGGDGGAAFGGAIELVANGGTMTLIPRSGASGVDVFTYTRGGNGGNAADSSQGDVAGDGGSAIGNAVRLLARGGTISSGGAPVRIATGGQTSDGGSAINSITGANVPGFGNPGFGGTIAIRTEQAATGNSAINLGPTTLNLDSPFGGGIEIRNQVAGDAIHFAGLIVGIAGRTLANPGGLIDNSGLIVDAGSGRIVVNGDALISTRSNAVFAATNSGGIMVNGDFYSSTEGRTDVFHSARTSNHATVRATGDLGFFASNFSATDGLAAQAGGDLSVIGVNSVALGDVVGTGSIEVGSGGNINAGRTTTTGNVTINAGGTVSLTGPASAGGDIALRGASLNFGELTATNAITLEASASGITSTAPLRAGTDLTVTAAGAIAIADARAGDDIRLTGGGMTLGDLRATGTGADNEGDGSDFIIASTGDVTIDHAEARSDFRANAVRFATGLNSIITGGDIVINAANTVDLGNSTAGGLIDATGSQIAFNILTAGGDVRLTTVAGSAQGPSGPLGNGSIEGIEIGAGGSLNLNALGRIKLGTANAATNLTLLSGADIAFTVLTSGGAMAVTSASSIAGERFNAGGDATFIARAGDVAIIDPSSTTQASATNGNLVMRGTQVRFGRVTATGNADIDASTLLSGAALTVGGVTVLDADSGAIDLALASTGAVTATADTANLRGTGTSTLNIAQITTDVGGATVVSQNDLVVQNAMLAGSSRFESTSGEVNIGQATVTSGNLDVSGRRDATLGEITVAGDMTATTRGVLTVDGAVVATTITGNSGDIVIGANGRLGALGRTQSVLLTNSDNSAPAFIGGSGTRNGWHLDATEITRLFGASIGLNAGRITAPGNTSVGSSNPVDVFVDDFIVDAAQQFGPTGSFAITTPGKLRVVGDARFTNMGDGQSFAITANDALEVIMGDGSIVLTGAGTELGGTLRLVSDDIIVATLAAIADVGAATSVSAINDRLALNDGITNDRGAIAAKGIDVNARNGFYVQNSGTPGIAGRDYANRRGLSFGALGLNIASQNNGLRIVINGQHIGAAGPVTGLDTIALIAINGATGATTGFDAGSTVNGCVIANVGACRIGPDNGGPPIQDRIIEEEDEENKEGTAILVSPLITLRGLDPLAGEPLIDDPVTGAGNDDLWTPAAGDTKD